MNVIIKHKLVLYAPPTVVGKTDINHSRDKCVRGLSSLEGLNLGLEERGNTPFHSRAAEATRFMHLAFGVS